MGTFEMTMVGGSDDLMASDSVFRRQIQQGSEPSSVLSFELRAMDGPSPSEARCWPRTVRLWTLTEEDKETSFRMGLPVLLEAGQQYAIVIGFPN